MDIKRRIKYLKICKREIQELAYLQRQSEVSSCTIHTDKQKAVDSMISARILREGTQVTFVIYCNIFYFYLSLFLLLKPPLARCS